MVLHHVVSHAYDEVSLPEAAVVVVMGLQPRRAQKQRMRGGHGALGHERRHHGDVEFLGEGDESLGRSHADDPVPRHDERNVGRVDKGRHALEIRRIGIARPGALPAQGLETLHFHLGDVLRQLDEAGAGTLRLGDLESLAHDLGDGLGGAHLSAILGDGLEQADQVDHLVALLVKPGGGGLPGDGHQRGHVHVGVGDPGHQVRCARPESGEADPGPPGQPSVDVGHESGSLLMTGGDEPDAAGGDGIHELENLLARHPEDELDSLVLKAPSEQIRGFH